MSKKRCCENSCGIQPVKPCGIQSLCANPACAVIILIILQKTCLLENNNAFLLILIYLVCCCCKGGNVPIVPVKGHGCCN